MPATADVIALFVAAEVMRGIRRDWGKPPARKTAAIDEDLKRMVDAVPPQSRRGLRDRALLLFGFAGAFRRAELVMLDTAHYDSGGKAFAPTRPELTCAHALYAGGMMFCTRGSQ